MKQMTKWLLAAVASVLIAQTGAAGEVIVYSAEEMIEFIAEKFEEKYPDIKVRIVLGSSGELSARAVAEADNPQGDVMWVGTAIELEHPELFHPVKDLDLDDMDPMLPSHDLKVTTHTYAAIYIVNHEQLGGAPAPTTWAELADPKWKGRFYMGNPITSNAAFMTMLAWYQIGGWELVEKIAANAVITQGSVDPVRAVGNGEATVGSGAERAAYQWTDGDLITAVYPQDGMSMMHANMYLVKNSPNEEEAKIFVNFMLSAEAQEAMSEEYLGVRPSNKNARVGGGLISTSELKIFDPPAEVLTDRKPYLDRWKEIIASVR